MHHSDSTRLSSCYIPPDRPGLSPLRLGDGKDVDLSEGDGGRTKAEGDNDDGSEDRRWLTPSSS